MANDWIKMRASLFTNPKVLRIASAIGMSPESKLCHEQNKAADDYVTRAVTRDVTIASLMRVWCAANEHTEDGVWHGIDREEFDLIAGIDGFLNCMESVGWAKVDEVLETISLPNFLDYNMPSRAYEKNSSAERQRRYREKQRLKSNGNDDVTRDVTTVTSASRRLDKIRLEEKPLVSAKRRTQLSVDFQPNETAFLKAKSLNLDAAKELERFRDHHTAKGTVMLDWQAAFRTWLTNAAKFKKPWEPSDIPKTPDRPVNGMVWDTEKKGWVKADA